MSLLEEAIVDANALKEAALKNAENLLKEKYSQEIKENFFKFLEQDEMDPAEDPLAGDLAGLDAGPAALDPTASQIPSAATEGERACSCPEEDEEIEINFDQLRAQMNGQSDPNQMSNPAMGGGEPPVFQEDGGGTVQISSQFGPDLHQYVMSKGDPVYQLGSYAFMNKPAPSSLVQSALSNLQNLQGKLEDQNDEQHLQQLIAKLQGLLPQQPVQEEEMVFNENIFSDLLETMNVDFENVPLGHGLGASTTDEEHQKQIELAALQDEERKKEMEQLQKTVKKLTKENQSLVSEKETLNEQVKSLQLEKNKFMGFAQIAAEKLQQYVVDNAKLHYANQVLKSNSLNERQKEHLVERISKVGSAEDAKLVFESLKDSIRTSKDKQKQTLDEHLKKENIFLKKKADPVKHSPEKQRMLEMAGIKKKS